MPICPNCHKFISDAKWRRHLDYIRMDEKGKKIIMKGRCKASHRAERGLHYGHHVVSK